MVDATRRRTKRRALHERLRTRVPAWYSPYWHLLGNAALAAGLTIVFAAQLDGGVRPWAWLSLPIALLVANAVEYAIHRYPMHKRTRGFDRFFKSHTLVHHRVFDERDFDLGGPMDAYFVLTTLHTTLLSLMVLVVSYALLGLALGGDVAAITSIGFVGYAMAVEVMHLILHLPKRWFDDGPLRWAWLHRLREHHRSHHDPRLMTQFNFNLAFPVTDFIVGSRHPAARTVPEVQKFS